MKVVVTGGCGFIGSHIAAKLIDLGHDVLILDNVAFPGTRGYERLIEMGTAEAATLCDITHAANLKEIVKWFNPEVICHQAGQSSLQYASVSPQYDLHVNAFGTINVLNAASYLPTPARIVFAGTSAVYANVVQRQGIRQTLWEGSRIEPISNYGMSKLAAEHYIRHSNLHYTILRYGNVYGPTQIPVGENQVVPRCLQHLLTGSSFAIHGNGRAQRDYVYIDDVVDANVRAILNPTKLPVTLNIGTKVGTYTSGLCNKLAEICGKKGYVFERDTAKEGELPKVILDSLSAYNALHWKAKTDLDAGLQLTVQWWKQKGMHSEV